MADSILPLEVNALAFCIGAVEALKSASFSIAAGTRTVILGPNGAGKSVLLRLLHGLLAPSAGNVRWTLPLAIARRRQAMVFQRPVMLRRSALDNVRFALRVSDLGGETEVLAHAALARVGLAQVADRPARVLSGGEQQRLALARAWALGPEVLFLDEPTASLDPAATRTIEEIILAMHLAGTTIVMTTHDLGQAKRIADEVLFLHHGCLLEKTPAAAFFNQPHSKEAAAFMKGELLW